MYLKRLELQGFKSFANKTVVKFEEGITAVVGPNGSGKSNISDAVRWVLGEQSAKTLRGDKMEDVIFSGTEERNPLGFAEVSLVLNNESGIFGLDYKEIVITRRVFRTGESEYYINKKVARLKDIREVFMDTGVGKDGYSIISQGKIDEILSSKSEDRRNIFEEAAGIVKYKTRKIESERKLEKTRENLVRIEDIISEIEGQIEPLEEQAEKAEKYVNLSESLKNYEIELLSNELKEYKEKKKTHEESVKKFEERISVLEREKSEFEDHLQDIQERQEKNENEYSETNEERYRLVSDKEKIRGSISLKEGRIEFNSSENKRISSEIENLGNDLEELSEKEKNAKAEFEDIEEQLKKKESILEEKNANIDGIKEKVRFSEEYIEKLKGENIDNLNKISNLKIRKSGIESNYENYERREKQINSALENIDEKDRTASEQIKEAEEKFRKASEELEKSDSLIKRKENELGKLKTESENLKRKMEGLKIQHEKDKSSLRILKEMKDDYEGYYKGVKNFLNAVKNSNINTGIEGVVAELVKTEKEFEKAIEVALGGAIQNIVTSDTEYAKESINFLKRNKLGRITFLPLDNIRSRNLNDREEMILNEKGIIGRASDLIEYDEKYRNIFENILGRVIIADNMDNMTAVSKKYSNSFKMVSLDGDVMNPGGSMTGGSFRGNTLSLLGRTRQIDDLEEKLKEIREEYISERDRLSETEEKLRISENEISEFKSENSRIQMEKNSLENSLNNLLSSHGNIDSEKKGYYDELEAIKEEKAQIDRDKSEIDGQIKDIESENREKDQKVIKETEVLTELNSELSKANGELVKIQVGFASITETHKNLENSLKNYDSEREKTEKRIEDEKRRLSGLISETENLEKSLKEEKNSLKETEENIEKNRLELERLSGIKEELKKSSDGCEEDIRKRESEHSEVQENLSKERIDLERVNMNMSSIRSRLWEEYEMSIMLAENVEKSGLDNSILRREVGSLKKKIKALGNVNVDSIEELKAVKERFEFLSSQRDDLVEGEKSLKVVIREMNTKMKQQFLERFEEIREQFKIVFRELFGGGRADIIIEDEEDILNSGIEVIAEPPGKKLQNLTLLSGGERALTAISILFAILKTKPTPFCILDEIEAALDEANVYRYAEYLKKFSEESQFIVITHRKGTMEAADTIYGVTMQDSGISELISVDLSEYDE